MMPKNLILVLEFVTPPPVPPPRRKKTFHFVKFHKLTQSLFQGEDSFNSEKRFTRTEMDKVIREKNMYKEKYLELQEDLR